MKNDTKKIMMYISLGALITVFILYITGRLKTEMYQEGKANETETELKDLLAELEEDETNPILKMVSGPTPMN